MVVNRNKRNKNNKSKGNKDFFGLLLIIVSAIFLLCLIIPPILSFISEGIRYVLLGLFGIFSYALFGGLLALGICLFLNKRIRVNKPLLIMSSIALFILMLVFQLISSHGFLTGNFGEYLSGVYQYQYTAGGTVFGIMAYALAFIMTEIAAYIVLGLAFAVMAFFIGRKIYLKYKPATAKKIIDKSALSGEYDDTEEEYAFDSFEPHYKTPRSNRPANSLFCERIVTRETRNADFVTEKNHGQLPELKSRPQQKMTEPEMTDDNNFGRRMGSQEAKSWLYDRDEDIDRSRSLDPELRQQLRNSLYVSEKKSEPAKAKPPSVQPIIQPGSYGIQSAEEYSMSKSAMPRKIVHENKNIHRVILPIPKQSGDDIPGEIVNSSLFKSYPQPPIVREYQQSQSGSYVQPKPPVQAKPDEDEDDRLPIASSYNNFPSQPKADTGFGFFNNFEEEAQSKFSNIKETPAVAEDAAEDDFPIISNSLLAGDEYEEPSPPEKYSPIKQQTADTNSSPIISSNSYFDSDNEKTYQEPAKYSPIKPQQQDYNDNPIINSHFLNEKVNEVKSTYSDYRAVKPEAVKPVKPLIPQNDIIADSSFGNLSYDDNDDGFADDERAIDTEPKIISTGLIFDDAVIDKTERDYDFGTQDSGYYTNENVIASDSNIDGILKPKKTPRHKANDPIGGQLSIEDAVSVVPDQIPVIKRAEPYYYNCPPLDLLLDPRPVSDSDAEDIGTKRELIEATLGDLKYPAKVINVIKGPTVTRFELQPPAGMSVRKILGKDSDIEYALATKGVRIEAPIAGKQAIGIEVPNVIRDIVYLKELLDCPEFSANDTALPLALGKDLGGSKIIKSLEKMPHLLVAGATGTGKSVCLNALILSLVYHCSPEDMRMVLVDPKCVEFAAYRNLPHLLIPTPIIDPQHTINSFDWAITEMNNRYQLFSARSVRNIGEYNKTPEVKSGKVAKLPYIVFIVDELADLMLSRKREVEDRIRNITQKSRAAGIHLILATQRPSVDVITGTIKINLPCRIAFSVTSNPDSRTVLDQGGAESLIGNGDMLFMPQDSPDLKRLQGALVTNDEISSIVSYVIQNNKAIFDRDIENAIFKSNEPVPETAATSMIEEESGDEKILPNIMRTLITSKSASTSMIQRRFAFGYARASRIIDIIEQRGWIGKMEGSKPREVFMTVSQFEEIFGRPFNEEE